MKGETGQFLNKPVQCLKGVGETRTALFHKLNIYTVGDVVTHYPRNYEDRSRMKKIGMLEDGEQCSFEGMVVSGVVESRPRRGLVISKILLRDETGSLYAVWFNQSYLKRVFKAGERYVFFGKITKRRTFEVLNPVYEKLDGNIRNSCRIMPIYPATGGLSQNIIRSAIRGSLDMVSGKLTEILPQWLRSRYGLPGINYSVNNIHFPASDKDFKNARCRLVFEELLLLQLGLLGIKNSIRTGKGIVFGADAQVRDLIRDLPFSLTNAQTKVLADLNEDMENGRVMNRLIQGDVGSGKTVVALIALYKAVKSGYQGALMVPTEILAEQHYHTVEELFKGRGIKAALLKGSMSAKSKSLVAEGLESGDIDIVIGTHALIEEKISFARLGIAITDEQHRFGVRQRTALSKKGDNPDIIVMTATPIPRTLALILYGDLDISVIDELPPGRKHVETYVVNNSMRERVNNFIRKNVTDGGQVYIVCPLVDESDTVEAKAATEHAKQIAGYDFPDLRVGLVHGRMPPREKDAVMESFIRGETDILVSTTVIEVGVNVPNAALMIVENAERFGLSQLHQLRGRVGRGSRKSYCILYNESESKLPKERMKIMEKTDDGFLISEKDLELRGPGDFFGTMQHGIPDLKIANLYSDMDILKEAQEAARILLEQDRFLEKPENRLLGECIREKFAGRDFYS